MPVGTVCWYELIIWLATPCLTSHFFCRFCVHWQAIQREFCKVPAPSFLVYYRLRFTSSPQTPLSADEALEQASTKPGAKAERGCPGERPEGQTAKSPGADDERFIALVRFAVIASKGQQEWLSSGRPQLVKTFFLAIVASLSIRIPSLLQVNQENVLHRVRSRKKSAPNASCWAPCHAKTGAHFVFPNPTGSSVWFRLSCFANR